MTATAQKAQRVMVPGKGGIDVEQLNKRVNLNQDISQLSLTELRVLRNSFYAREGFPFRGCFPAWRVPMYLMVRLADVGTLGQGGRHDDGL